MASTKLYQGMIHYLESMIVSGALPPGGKLPSQRELSEQFNLAKGTVGRGLGLLAGRGLIELRHGSGAYVRSVRSGGPGDYSIGILVASYGRKHSYCGDILIGVQRAASECGCELTLKFADGYADYRGDLKRDAEKRDAMMLIGPFDPIAAQLPASRPAVGVNVYRTCGFLSTVDLDAMAAAELAADYFRRRGKTHVAVLTNDWDGAGIGDAFAFRCRMFQAVWAGEISLHPSPEEMPPVPAGLLGDPAAALLFLSGSRADRAIKRYAEETGRSLPDDICLLTIDGKSLLEPSFTPVDTVAVDYRQMGCAALAECLARIRAPGSGPRRIFQPVWLHTRPNGKPASR